MKVYVNGYEVDLFHGATLKHALLKTDESLYQAVIKNNAAIYDEDGNLVDIDGSVEDGFSYKVVERDVCR